MVACALAFTMGVLANQFRSDALPLGSLRMSAEAFGVAAGAGIALGIPEIGIQEVQVLYEQGDAVFLDVRSREAFELGHIPGALHISSAEFEWQFERFRHFLESDRERILVVYCSGLACRASAKVAARLRELGFENAVIFPGGWEKWSEAAR